MNHLNLSTDYFMKPVPLTVIASLLVSQFFLGGVNKIRGFEKTVLGLQKRFNPNLPVWFYQLAIVGVILLEILAPLAIVMTTMRKVKKEYAILSLVALAIFTVWATYIYHFPPFGMTFYPFISNTSAVGGLLAFAVFLGQKL
jgi:hypothetical protein